MASVVVIGEDVVVVVVINGCVSGSGSDGVASN